MLGLRFCGASSSLSCSRWWSPRRVLLQGIPSACCVDGASQRALRGHACAMSLRGCARDCLPLARISRRVQRAAGCTCVSCDAAHAAPCLGGGGARHPPSDALRASCCTLTRAADHAAAGDAEAHSATGMGGPSGSCPALACRREVEARGCATMERGGAVPAPCAVATYDPAVMMRAGDTRGGAEAEPRGKDVGDICFEGRLWW